MEQIELVIKMQKNAYNEIESLAGWNTINIPIVDAVFNAIANGTPLPEGHGRLISENDMLSVILYSGLFDYAKVGEVKKVLLNIPTIIEADKEGAEK